MDNFSLEKTDLKGIDIIHSFSTEDQRGCVIKDFSQKYYSENGKEFSIIESLQIFSRKGTLRGLHIQKKGGQTKLIQCIFGKVCIVVIDLRKESEQFGQSILYELNGLDGISILIPPQFALGTLAIEDSIISCKCDQEYAHEYDTGIIWNDNELNIQWPLYKMNNTIILSEKDNSWKGFIEYKNKM